MLDDSGTVLSRNKPATDLTGQNTVAQHLSQHIRAPAVLEAVERVVDSGAPDQVHYERRIAGGRLFEVFITPVAAVDVTRTTLASLTGFIETLQGSARNDVRARDKFLGRMLEQAHRMRRLIDDLLSLSRIEMNLHRTPSDQADAGTCLRPLATA